MIGGGEVWLVGVRLFRPILQYLFHICQEVVAAFTVNCAVVEDVRKINHRTNSDGIVTVFIGNYDCAFLHGTSSQNTQLGLVDDRHGKQRSSCAVIGERERTSANLFWLEPLVAGTLTQIINLSSDSF